MLTALILLTLAIIPHDAVLRESVCCIERNHFYDDQGRHVFDQWIFFDDEPRGWVVVAWRLDKGNCNFRERPPVLTWTDADDTLRQVRADCWRESWTQYDPELEARERLPKERRRGLVGEKR